MSTPKCSHSSYKARETRVQKGKKVSLQPRLLSIVDNFLRPRGGEGGIFAPRYFTDFCDSNFATIKPREFPFSSRENSKIPKKFEIKNREIKNKREGSIDSRNYALKMKRLDKWNRIFLAIRGEIKLFSQFRSAFGASMFSRRDGAFLVIFSPFHRHPRW